MSNAFKKLVFLLACASLAPTCTSGSGNGHPGSAGSTGNPGSAGTTGAAGSTAGTTGTGGSTTGTAGSTTGTGGTTGTAGSATGTGGSTTGTAGSATGTAGSTTGTAGATTGTAGRGGTTGAAGSTSGAAGASGTGGTAPAPWCAPLVTGAAGSVGPTGTPPACQAPIAITTGVTGAVTANLGTTVNASVSGDLFGVHTSVYDANMQLATTPDLLKQAGVTSLRYPGGSYADLYHWSLHAGTHTPASGAGSNNIYVALDTDFAQFLCLMSRIGGNALITVDYGMNSKGTGPGEPKEAAAWVAYANGSTSSTVNIGTDGAGTDWKNVAFWAGLRASMPLATDDGYNHFRINHPTPFGVKYWEVGNELYGNGWYYGSCGWEADMHLAYPPTPDGGTANCTNRMNASQLSPATYGAGVKAFSQAMKAVDPTIKVGGIVVAHSDTEYTNWNSMVLPQACASMDFASVHWYPGMGLTNIQTLPETEVPKLFMRAHTATGTSSYNCPGGASMPVAITEWGPNTNCTGCAFPVSTATAAPAGSQAAGLFAAESYANFMEQGALAAHWLELHNNSYLAGVDATNDPFTTANDTPRWGYKGAQMAHFLAKGGDKIVQAVTSTTGFGTQLKSHASVHANGDIAVMMTNTNRNNDANITVTFSGGSVGCVGARYSYTAVNTDQDGPVAYEPIFAASAGTSVQVLVPKYSTVVIVFPKK